jgi:hypothetical protein
LTGPHPEAFQADLFAQERLRRARLVSALLLLLILVVVLLLPSTYPSSPSRWTAIIILSGGGILIALVNRAGYTALSSTFYVLLVDTALIAFFYLKPDPALNSTNMTILDLFLVAVLVGGVILPKGLIPFLRPHGPSITELIALAGNPSVALTPTLVLISIGTALAWLHAWSVERALIRASQAEARAEARAELSRQAELTAQKNQRLQEGINSILETHRQIAAGNLAARAPGQEDHELWQIGRSLNLLLMRVQQQAQGYATLQASQQEIEQVITALNEARMGARPAFPPVALLQASACSRHYAADLRR